MTIIITIIRFWLKIIIRFAFKIRFLIKKITLSIIIIITRFMLKNKTLDKKIITRFMLKTMSECNVMLVS